MPTKSHYLEIERRFIVPDAEFLTHLSGQAICQGYLSEDQDRLVRVRSTESEAALTIKARTESIRKRIELEYPIPIEDAKRLLEMVGEKHQIFKTRYEIDFAGHRWEVDLFSGENAGLVIAEIELDSEQESFEHPPWIGEEITSDPKYLNINLVRHPYQQWKTKR